MPVVASTDSGENVGCRPPTITGTSSRARTAPISRRPRSHWRVVSETPSRPGSSAATAAATSSSAMSTPARTKPT
jgi:hypothetical protein